MLVQKAEIRKMNLKPILKKKIINRISIKTYKSFENYNRRYNGRKELQERINTTIFETGMEDIRRMKKESTENINHCKPIEVMGTQEDSYTKYIWKSINYTIFLIELC